MIHPDQKYIDAILTNNVALLEELYHRTAGRIKHLVLQNNGCETDAADLMQDALLAIFNRASAKEFILTCPIDAFIFIICKKNWLKKLHKKKLEGVTMLLPGEYMDITDDSFDQADKCLIDQERKKLVMDAFAQLGEGCRKLLALSWSGKSMEEVGTELNISYGYARKRKSKCMEKLVSIVRQSPLYDHVKW